MEITKQEAMVMIKYLSSQWVNLEDQKVVYDLVRRLREFIEEQ
jgi:hypothetical protein